MFKNQEDRKIHTAEHRNVQLYVFYFYLYSPISPPIVNQFELFFYFRRYFFRAGRCPIQFSEDMIYLFIK